MLSQRLLLAGVAFFLLLVGCISGEEKAMPEASPPAPEEVSPQMPREESPPDVATEEREVLHGEGRCDQCHEAQTLEDIRAGVHEQGFTLFEGHREFCRECHDVQDTCTNCHSLPDVMK